MLIEEYPKVMEAAKALFGNRAVADRGADLEKSYSVCKNAWERNLKRIEGIPIKYLLICEAPPAPKNGHVSLDGILISIKIDEQYNLGENI